MKQLFAVLFACLIAPPLLAQTGTECPIPEVRFDPTASHAERLDAAIISQTFVICTQRQSLRDTARIKPEGDAELVRSMLDAFEADLDLLTSRLTMPPIEDYRAAFARIGRDKQAVAWADYLSATAALHFYDTCNRAKGECAIDLPIMKAVPDRHGMAPRPWVAMIARTMRPEPMPPWFRLGSVSMRYEPDSLAFLRIKSKLDEATRARDEAIRVLDKAKADLAAQLDKRAGVLAPLRQRIEKDRQTLFRMEMQRKPDSNKVMKDPGWQARADIARRAEKRVDELDRAMASVFATEGNTAAGQKRLREMQDERDAEALRADTAWAERIAMLQPDYTAEERAIREKLEQEIGVNQRDHDRRQAIYDGWIREAEIKLVKAQVTLDAAYEVLGAAQKEMQKWYAGQSVASVLLIETDHARFVPAKGDELDKLRTEIARLEAEIADREARRADLQAKREEARQAMLAAGQTADRMNDRLAAAGLASMMAQYAVEAGFSARDFIKSIRGGPAAMLAEAARQGVGIYLSPPSYYDASTKRLSDYARGQDTPSDWALVDLDSLTSRETLVKTVEKNWANLPLKTLVQSLTQENLWRDQRIGWKQFKTVDGNMWQQLRKIGETEVELEKVTKELRAMTGRAGAFAAVKSFTTKLGEGVAKSIAKEATKKAMAEILEGSQFEEYMLAQVDLSQAVARFQHAGGLYWSNEDLLALARAKLSGLLQRDLGPSLLIDERNEPFYPQEGYALRFEFSASSAAQLRDAKIEVFLAGLKLERDQGTTQFIWRLSAEAAERLHRGLPEALPIEILVQ
ncbi:hypothetical protein [Mameliella sediminis]|uniref:hypothetical protein n=1 Tax=Mameliella sediminis TaxID=2836866 RepID=UPI001C462B10|nr:hypothetical protein [Mameliella sediminis]MBV7393105.1 hypothetical protein [Mameliella sediminis]